MRLKYFITPAIIALTLAALVLFVGWKPQSDRFTEQKTEVLIREIGHMLLLQSGDSSSRILPVKQLSPAQYQLRFETQFGFIPDSLVNIVQRVIQSGHLPADYIVNVFQCNNKEIIFGFAILGTEEKRVVPCLGRNQPRNCYYIEISFQPGGNAFISRLPKSRLIFSAIILLLLAAFVVWKKRMKAVPVQQAASLNPVTDGISIGKYLLRNGELWWETEMIPLSSKELKVLSIFAASPNQVIDRARLQKEGWEDEGVIVGRSLDMFISKLRKKFEKDPGVKLVNIHGKGYKLEINPGFGL